jgi:hypothetical protein
VHDPAGPSIKTQATEAMTKSAPEDFLEVTSKQDGPCTLCNNWSDSIVGLHRINIETEPLSGNPLAFATTPGKHVVVKSGTDPARFRRTTY